MLTDIQNKETAKSIVCSYHEHTIDSHSRNYMTIFQDLSLTCSNIRSVTSMYLYTYSPSGCSEFQSWFQHNMYFV